MVWRPLDREPDALSELVRRAALARIFPTERSVESLIADPEDGTFTGQLPDGRRVRLGLVVSPDGGIRHGVRACATLNVSGDLAVDRNGYRIEGAVAVDLATRAVLDCEIRMSDLGESRS